MRQVFAIAAVLFVSPAWAYGPSKAYPCWVRVHKGAQPYLADEKGSMEPVPTIGPTTTVDTEGTPILYIDTQTMGAPWVWQLRGYAYHRSDVDLVGNCNRVRVE